MTGRELQQARRRSRRTQIQAARDLGVSQTYLSMLEKGLRPLTEGLSETAVRAFSLSPTELPLRNDLATTPPTTDDELATDLATLGYEGFLYLNPAKQKNPVEVLLLALKSNDRDARLVEALPWLVLKFPDMDWDALVTAAKVNDLQNKLGYVVNIARRLSAVNNDKKVAVKLEQVESVLDRSLLFRETTLCNESMTNAELKWIQSNRPDEARKWRLFTYLSPEHIRYGPK
ncbi:MAG: helix-turn-helix transcriptional regulator [Pyrinomonadaceae bacterium]